MERELNYIYVEEPATIELENGNLIVYDDERNVKIVLKDGTEFIVEGSECEPSIQVGTNYYQFGYGLC